MPRKLYPLPEIGQRFGRLEVVRVIQERPHKKVLCVCHGDELAPHRVERVVLAVYLWTGRTQSCGCARKKTPPNSSAEYMAWGSMVSRCVNRNDSAYKNYGGRGIRVDPAWVGKGGFQAFYASVGPRPPGKSPKGRALWSLGRIDNDGPYAPGNVEWQTQQQQDNNKRTTVRITVDGTTKSVTAWCAELNLNRFLVYERIRNGWDPKDALFINNTRGDPAVMRAVAVSRYRRGLKIARRLIKKGEYAAADSVLADMLEDRPFKVSTLKKYREKRK